MSSRALKKKHGRNDLEAIEKSLQDKENQDESDEGSSQGDGVHIASSKKNNIFSLAALVRNILVYMIIRENGINTTFSGL